MLHFGSTPSRAIVLLPLVAGLAVWITAVRWGWIDPWLLPSPGAVLASLVHDRSELSEALLWTSIGAGLGFLVSTLIGVTAAILLSLNAWTYRALYPYAVVFQTVPIIAVAPILVIWFGYGTPTVVAASFLASLFPVLTSTLNGLSTVDPALRDLFRLYRASRVETLFKLVLPFALPQIFTGLRIGAGLAVIGAIVGEFVGGSGLGSVVDAARTQQRIDKVFAAVFLACLLGTLSVNLLNQLGRWVLNRWHPSLGYSDRSLSW